MHLAPLHPADAHSEAPSPSTGWFTHRPGEGARGDGADGITPAKILHALRRRWFIAFPLAAALAALAYTVADRNHTPIYTARTLVHVGTSQPVILYDDLGGYSDTANYQRTQIATVKSRLVRQAVVRDLLPSDLAVFRSKADPVGWLEKEIQADYSVAPEILRITMKGANPDELVLLLNAVREAYLREVINKDRGDRTSRLAGLTELASKHERSVRDARQKLTQRAEAHGTRDMAELRAKHDRVTGQLQTLQTELLLARVTDSGGDPAAPVADGPDPDAGAVEAALDRLVATDPLADGAGKDVVRLKKKLADFEHHLLGYQTDPDYKQATADLVAATARLAGLRNALRPNALAQLRPAKNRYDLTGGTPDRSATRFRVPLLGAEIRRKELEITALAKDLSELDRVRLEVAGKEEELALVNSKVRRLEVELQAPARARVLEEATIVETPKWDRWFKYTIAPTVGAFFAVVALVTWLDLRRGGINGSSELTATGIRVIGAVPAVRAAVLPGFVPPTAPGPRQEYAHLTDAFDMARAILAPVVRTTAGYVLTVTSAGPGEGKTFLAGHLAVRFARSGSRTLLVDADVRRPQLHRLFGLAPAPGVGEWVTGGADRAGVVRAGPVPGLDVICAGRSDSRTVSELSGLRLPELLETVRRDYDVIIIDTAPVLSTPEALSVSRAADGVVLSVMRDVSRVSAVLASAERLASVNARVLGAVVTGDAAPRYSGA